MACNSGLNMGLQQQNQLEWGIFTNETSPSASVQSLDTDVHSHNVLTPLGKHFVEYGRLFLTFLSLYFQGRILMVQNFILSCKLQMWELAFIYFKLQIFFVRLANGFPFDECWPRK